MKIVGIYSFKGGQTAIQTRFPRLLQEIEQVIANIDAAKHKTKTSKEKTMPGKMLYKPGSLNKSFKRGFTEFGWESRRVSCEYSTEHYTTDYVVDTPSPGAFREMDFVKGRVGVEVQFGKYAFVVYNVCAKMTIFHNLDIIDLGVEIVPVKSLTKEMSSGVSYFEQFVWDLENRGVSNIDIPVLILEIAA